jgi:hypothetical protein
MVSGINYTGHLTLRKCSIRNETGSRLKSHKTVNEVLLHATASIFVRDHEVVAVAASYGRLIAVEGWTEETTAGEPLPASEEQHASDNSDGDSGDLASRISRIAVVINPRKEDKFLGGSHCMLLNGGKSHFRLLNDKKAWAWFLRIP